MQVKYSVLIESTNYSRTCMKRNRNKWSIVRDPKFVPLNYCNFYLYYAATS